LRDGVDCKFVERGGGKANRKRSESVGRVTNRQRYFERERGRIGDAGRVQDDEKWLVEILGIGESHRRSKKVQGENMRGHTNITWAVGICVSTNEKGTGRTPA